MHLSKLILFQSATTRDFINISASSIPKVFGVDPFFLPATTDNGLTVPKILVLLKAKLIQMNGLKTVRSLRRTDL